MSLKSSFQVGTTRTRPASTKWRRLFLMTALVGLSVTMAAVFYWVSAPRFAGFRVLAPSSACWRGSISGGLRQFTNVSGCGSTSPPGGIRGQLRHGRNPREDDPGQLDADHRGVHTWHVSRRLLSLGGVCETVHLHCSLLSAGRSLANAEGRLLSKTGADAGPSEPFIRTPRSGFKHEQPLERHAPPIDSEPLGGGPIGYFESCCPTSI